MNEFDLTELKKLFVPAGNSHKGQNGKLMIIAGSMLFHSAPIWSLTIASRIVDMVYFSSVPSNNIIVQKSKESFKNGIVIPRHKIDEYIEEADCILIGPGLPRDNGREPEDDNTKSLTTRLLLKFPEKRWIIDGGSLQTIAPEILPKNAIITPHKLEFKKLFNLEATIENAIKIANKYEVVILLKGEEDIIVDKLNDVFVRGGNQGMTKGGTGDVLAGLVASFYCKNDAFLSASCASYINKKAGEGLEKKVGIYFNTSDLVDEIPKVMKELIL